MDRIDQLQKAAKEKEEGFQEGKPSNVPIKSTRPPIVSPRDEVPSPSADGGSFLRHFMYAHPFMDLFEYGASRFTPDKRLRVQNLRYRVLHPNLYKHAIRGDFLIRLVVVCIVVTVATMGALKLIQ